MSDLPPGWVKKISSRTGKEYYIDPVTKESQWEHPSATSNKPSGGRRAANGDQVQVLHILVKHTGSRNPKNYKGETITRSKADARRRLDDIINELENTNDLESTFRRIAKDKSDCSSGQRGGDLGMFGHGAMQKAFEEASFALDVNEMSNVVDSDSGLHVILRIA
ncbi:unnamed protein product [Rotaria magnacalcarata]|uniref:Peptidyl-prolyl cis-trans isomerase n=1 Tax=Rotaria magnacalcarata TaxID=392030 RepID=A0A819EHQ0_9BILA|nr:unnamed protein product [Rotaria magnacalcarata]CAF1665800.1 unnamed protein product [Rotaria magnacalcarata]CAF2044992.1 unnamed protein product [Rotaria magnacalcarata]CAF2047054.1 unnamed protein product [Rotaria magnacalcarata]CAF2099947.1 unnamed protein product [Rotaria magnacalcarata]